MQISDLAYCNFSLSSVLCHEWIKEYEQSGIMSQDSSVNKVTGNRMDRQGIFSSPLFWKALGTTCHSILWNTFDLQQSGQRIKLTTHLNPVPRLRMCRALQTFPLHGFRTQCYSTGSTSHIPLQFGFSH